MILLNIYLTLAWIIFIAGIAIIGYLVYAIRKSSLLDKLEKRLDDSPSQTFKGIEEHLANLNKHITPLSEQNKRLLEQNQSLNKLIEKFMEMIYESSEQDRKEHTSHNQQLQKLLHELSQTQKANNQSIERLLQQAIASSQYTNPKQANKQERIKPENLQKDEISSVKESEPQEQDDKVYYLLFPDSKGFFWNDKKSPVRQNGKSAFKMKIAPNGKSAQFTFLNDDETILKMVNSNPGFLKPVCNFKGNRMGRNYNVLKNGTLYYDNNKWIVDINNKIELEVI